MKDILFFLQQRLSKIFLLSLLVLQPVFATESLDQILAAARDSNLSRNPANQAVVLKHINTIHDLAGMRRMTTAEYNRVMAWHQIENLSIARRAAATLPGIAISPQQVADGAAGWRVGSDTDLIVRRTDGRPVTLEDIQALERLYRMKTLERIRRSSGGAIQPSPQSFDTGTDFMVAHDGTNEIEFDRIATYLQSQGRDTYRRIEAARVEAQYRTPGQQIDPRDASVYVAEMVDQTRRKTRTLENLVKQRRQASSDTERARLDAQIERIFYERSKYVQRINNINQRIASQSGAALPAEALIEMPRGYRYDTAQLDAASRRSYIRALAASLSGSQSAELQSQTAFMLALQLRQLPLRQGTAFLNNLPSDQRVLIQNQRDALDEYERIRRNRPHPAHIGQLENYLNQTEFGRNLLNLLGTEIDFVRAPVSQNVMALADLYDHVTRVDQSVQQKVQMLGLVMAMAQDVRDMNSDVELALSIGGRLANLTNVGTALQSIYDGTVGGDPMALVRAFAIYLVPKIALPDLVQSLGVAVMDLSAGVLGDHQFMVLYVNAKFNESGQLIGVEGVRGGSDAVCRFIDDALGPAGDHFVEGLFTRALALAEETNLSQEVLGGLNAVGTRAYVRALESTIYGGDTTFMGHHQGVQLARAAVRQHTDLIADIAVQQGRNRTDVPTTVTAGWVDERLAEERFDEGARQALRNLMELREQAWEQVKVELCRAIVEDLEKRHRAEQGLEGGDEAMQALLEKLEQLLRDLDIHEPGMAWLQYDGTRNFIGRWFGSTTEQRIEMMQTIQRYYDVYKAVRDTRATIESLYHVAGGSGDELSRRPLTGYLPLTADPAFDHQLASMQLKETLQEFDRHERKLLTIKRSALNDWQVTLDAPFDRDILKQLYATTIDVWNNNSHHRGAGHSRSRLYRIQVFETQRLYNESIAALNRVKSLISRQEEIIQEFRDHYAAAPPALIILPPPAVVEDRAKTDAFYAFGLEKTSIPQDARFAWILQGQVIGREETLVHRFEEAGQHVLEVRSQWRRGYPSRVVNDGDTSAILTVNIHADAPVPELTIRKPEGLGDLVELHRGYDFRAMPNNIPAMATFSWLINDEPAAVGADATLHFRRRGRHTIELMAEWEVSGSSTGREQVIAQPVTVEVEPADYELTIIPPPEILNEMGQVDTRYHFVSQSKNIPADASYTWRVHGAVHGTNPNLSMEFSQYGLFPIEVTASWTAPEEQGGHEEELRATYEVIIVPPPDEEPEPGPYFDPDAPLGDRPEPDDDADPGVPQPKVAPPVADGDDTFPYVTPPARIPPTAEGSDAAAPDVPPGTQNVALGESVNIDLGADFRAKYPDAFETQLVCVDCGAPRGEDDGVDSRGMLNLKCLHCGNPGDTGTSPFEMRENFVRESVARMIFTFRSNPAVLFDPATSTDGRTRITFLEPGLTEVWADVEITFKEDGRTIRERTPSHWYYVGEDEVSHISLTGLEGQVVFGQSVTMTANVDMSSTGEKPYRIEWHASPLGNTLEHATTTDGRNTLTIGRMGRVRIFALLQEKEGTTWATVAESDVYAAEVVAPQFDLVFTPPDNARIAENLHVKVVSHPPVPEGLIDFRWRNPVRRHRETPNASGIRFVIGEHADNPADPISLDVLAVTSPHGDRIGDIQGSYTPGKYELIVNEPRFRGPTPRVWDSELPGLVDAPRGTIVTHQQVTIDVTIEPTPPVDVRYRWNVSPSGANVTGSGTFSAHTPGTYRVEVTARTATGIELAKGERMVEVASSEPPPDFVAALIREAEELERQGDIEGAIGKYEEAQGLRHSADIARRIERLREELANRQRAQELVREGYTLESQGDYEGAIAKYEKAVQLYAVDGVVGRIRELREKLATRQRAQELVAEGDLLKGQKDLAGAITKYEEALRLYAIDGVAERIQRLRTELANRQRAADLVEEGYALERQGDYEGAIAKYEEAVQLYAVDGVVERIRELREKLATRQRAQELVAEGDLLKEQNDYEGAIARYEEALELYAIDGVAERIEELRETLSNRQKAEELLEEGYALEGEGDYEEAIAKYEEALELYAVAGVAERVRELRERLANRQRAQDLVREGYSLEGNDDYEGAIAKYEEALELYAVAGVAERVRELRERLANRQRAQDLVREGYSLEGEDDYEGAITKYEKALELYAVAGVAERVRELRERLANRQRAQDLVREGYTLEQQNDLVGAISKYEAAQQILPNDGVAQRIERLQNRIAAEQARIDAEQQRRREAEARRMEQQRLEQQRQEQARLEAEQRARQERARRQAEEERRREAQARREAEQRARQEREARAAEQARQEVARQQSLTGTFVTELREYGEHIRMELRLAQTGNQVSGELRTIFVGDPAFSAELEPDPIRGTIRGNRLVITTNPWESDNTVTISEDYRSLTVRYPNGETSVYRKR